MIRVIAAMMFVLACSVAPVVHARAANVDTHNSCAKPTNVDTHAN